MANPFVAWCQPTPLPCKIHQDPYGSWATGRALSPGSPQGFPRRPCAGRGSARPVARPGRHPLIPSIFPRSPAGTRCPGRPPPEHRGPDFWVSTPSREEPPPRSLAGAVNASTLSDEAQPLRSPNLQLFAGDCNVFAPRVKRARPARSVLSSTPNTPARMGFRTAPCSVPGGTAGSAGAARPGFQTGRAAPCGPCRPGSACLAAGPPAGRPWPPRCCPAG